MTRYRLWSACMVVGIAILVACGEGGNREWIVAWNTSWTGPESEKPVSRDGRYAYFVTEKFINPTLGRWDNRWRSAPYRGRVDLKSGRVDVGKWPSGYQMFGGSGLLISDTLSTILLSDSITGRPGLTNEIRITGYGDGRYVLLIRRPKYNPIQLSAFLLDNADSYRVIGTGFRDAWISTDEKFVVLVRQDTGDTWVYGIDDRQYRKLGTAETPPGYLRGLKDLPDEAQQIASAAMGRHCTQRRFRNIYPEQEELR